MTYTNAGLKLSLQSAIGNPITITALTNANPGVATAVGHGLSDGTIVLVRFEGTIEMNMRLFEIVNKATDTMQFRDVDTGDVGIDTTDFGVFSSGTIEVITFGTSITGVTDFSSSGGEIKKVDNTEVGDLVDKELPVSATAMSYNMTIKWDPSSPAQKVMQKAFSLRQARAFRIKWPDGRYAMFYGTVGFNGMPGGSKQDLTITQASVSMEGMPTYGIP
jgi:hypothetical protein